MTNFCRSKSSGSLKWHQLHVSVCSSEGGEEAREVSDNDCWEETLDYLAIRVRLSCDGNLMHALTPLLSICIYSMTVAEIQIEHVT